MMEKASIVRSGAGRDRGRLYYLLGTEGRYVYLTDGKRRGLLNPKRKNLRHIEYIAGGEGETAEKIRRGGDVCDREIRRSLEKRNTQGEGG